MSNHTHERAILDKVTFGFWLYLMSDVLLFASLFASYAVLQGNTFGGPGARDITDLPFVLVETMILLTSSFTVGLALLAAHQHHKKFTLAALGVTLLLGLSFVGMEVYEFAHLIAEGHGPGRSAFLSAFFTLVGTHGLHVSFGALWMTLLMVHVLRYGLSGAVVRKLTCLSLFWHFLDIIWIFIFTIVYLMGVI